MINSNPQYNDLIDAYFDDSMSIEERDSFIKELENNAQLKREFDFQLEIQQAISDPNYDDVNAAIEEVLYPQGKKASAKTGIIQLRSILKYAALIVVVLSISFLITQNLESAENKSIALVDEYFEPYPAYNTFRGEVDIAVLIESAFEKYESKQYAAASSDFAQLMAANPENMAFPFYNGNTQFALENYQEAHLLFLQVVESDNELFKRQAKWYLALCYLAMDKVESAREVFVEISQETDSNYNQRANEILGQLE